MSPNTAAKVLELEDSVREVFQHSRNNRKETGRLEGEFPAWFWLLVVVGVFGVSAMAFCPL